MKFKRGLVEAGLLSILTVACGSDSSKDGTINAKTSNLISSTTGQINHEIEQFENLAANGSPFHGLARKNIHSPLSTTWWTDSTTYGFTDPINYSGTISTNVYLPLLLKASSQNIDNASINVFGRIKTAMTTLCSLSQALAPNILTGSILSAGTYQIKFTADIKDKLRENCDADLPNSFSTATMTISPSDLANYEFKLELCTDSHTSCDESTPGYFASQYMTTNSSMIKIGVNEKNDSKGYIYQTIIELNKSTKIFKAEYRSLKNGSALSDYTFHRLFKTSSEAMVVSLENRTNHAEAYALKGDLDKSADKPIKLSFWNPNATGDEYQTGCYTRSSNTLVDNGATDCDTTSINFTSDTSLITNLMGSLVPNDFIIDADTQFNFNDFASALTGKAAH